MAMEANYVMIILISVMEKVGGIIMAMVYSLYGIYINILLSMEFPGMDIPDSVLLELVVRNMYKTCAEQHLQCNASNPYDVLKYLAHRNIKNSVQLQVHVTIHPMV